MKFEFDPNGEYMQEDYWGTHTPKDDCVYTRLPKSTPGMLQAIRRIWAEREPSRLATNTMNDFLRLPSRELIRRLRDGEAFIGENHPLGTIVRFDEERLSLGFRARTAHYTSEPAYSRNTYWGVVTQMDYPQPNRTVLMRISQGFVHTDRGWVGGAKFLTHDSTLEVGKVLHTRMAENEHWTASESFSRILSVDIWTIGKGVRKPVRESFVRGLLGKLVPNLGQSE